MEGPDRTGETLKEALLSSVGSTAFWSAIAAIVGLVAVASGGILYLAIDEIRDFSLGILLTGVSLLLLALILSPRAIAMFLAGRQGRYGSNVLIMTAAFFAIAILVNFLIFRNAARFDVTATRVFSLAPQSVDILKKRLTTPVRANAFFIPTDPGQTFARQQAEDLLDEFKRHTNKFTYRFVDPELKKSIAERYNVTRYPAIVFEDVDRGIQQGIVCDSLPNCFNFSERDFVTAVLIATGEGQKTVYSLTGHKEASVSRDILTGQIDNEGLDAAIQGMQRDNYRVQSLNLKQIDRVPDDAALLVIAGPKQDLDEAESRALAQYITGGGRLIALLDPDTPSSFVELISQWGVDLGGHDIADPVSNVTGEMLTPLVQRANGQYLAQPDVRITELIDVAFFPGVTSVDPVVPVGDLPSHIRLVPLAFTTPISWLETNVEDVTFQPEEDVRGPFSVATVVEATGQIDASESHPLAKLVIFGDSDFVKNKFFYDSDNADFFLNSVNWLAEDFELISIRPKVFPFREFVLNTRERDFIKLSSWLVPPAVMLVLGALVWWRRR